MLEAELGTFQVVFEDLFYFTVVRTSVLKVILFEILLCYTQRWLEETNSICFVSLVFIDVLKDIPRHKKVIPW